MSTLEVDIKESIAKNLPAHVGDVLQKRLQKAQEDEQAIVRLKAQAKELEERNVVLEKRVEDTRAELASMLLWLHVKRRSMKVRTI